MNRTAFYGRQLETAAEAALRNAVRPPFFRAVDYVNGAAAAF